VTKDGSGSGMLKNPELIGEMLCTMIASVKIPVTIKIRAGWDDHSINAPLITRIAEQAGAKAITIHGRTREQGYKGSANWDWIKECRSVAKNILLIGNGDIFDAEAALRMFAHTNCDAVLVSRGTMGKPWIAEDILRALDGLAPRERGPLEIRDTLMTHFDLIIRYRNERQALLDFRRVGCWYLKQCNQVKDLRIALNQATSTLEVMHLLHNFAWEDISLAQKVACTEEV
jgi:nifR3 family TIM-barrel protein